MRRTLAVFFFFLIVTFLTAEEPGPASVDNDDTAGDGTVIVIEPEKEEKHYLWALASAEFSNLFMFSINRFVGRTEFSKISRETISDNFQSEWQWDQSMFQTNQIGHPYHGATYFAAGRSSGLNFYESTLLAALGSATWEVACERCPPAMNDLIVTTIGGVSLGEICHRLYREAGGHPLAALVSPMDALTDLVLDNRPLAGTDNLTALSLRGGAGVAIARRYEDGASEGAYARDTPRGELGITIVYGDPFAHQTTEPFTQFDLDLSVGGGIRLFDAALLTDGFLLAFAPADGPRLRATVGLTLHYDFFFGNLFGFSANSLLVTVKAAAPVGDTAQFAVKAHAGWLGIGVTEYSPKDKSLLEDNHNYFLSYGTGFQGKIDVSIATPSIGTLGLQGAGYLTWALPGKAPDAEGWFSFARIKAYYLRPVSDRLGIGVSAVYMIASGFWKDLPKDDRAFSEATIYAQWSLM